MVGNNQGRAGDHELGNALNNVLGNFDAAVAFSLAAFSFVVRSLAAIGFLRSLAGRDEGGGKPASEPA